MLPNRWTDEESDREQRFDFAASVELIEKEAKHSYLCP